MKRVLVVTTRAAQEVDGVIDAVRSGGADVIRWNTCTAGEQPRTIAFVDGDVSLDPDVLGAGWFHELGPGRAGDELTGLERELALNERAAFWEGVPSVASCSWLNAPATVAAASNKPRQLAVATRAGAPVPKTVVTNDRGVFSSFASANRGAVVVKALRSGFTRYGERCVRTYTRRIASLPTTFADSLAFGPVVLQEEIERTFEVRVTIVDARCFSVSIDYAGTTEVDVRKLDFERERWRFRAAEDSAALPCKSIEAWSVKIVAELGLAYAGIDWIVDQQGKPYFLECNPLGAFKWYELCSGHAITRALADALLRRA